MYYARLCSPEAHLCTLGYRRSEANVDCSINLIGNGDTPISIPSSSFPPRCTTRSSRGNDLQPCSLTLSVHCRDRWPVSAVKIANERNAKDHVKTPNSWEDRQQLFGIWTLSNAVMNSYFVSSTSPEYNSTDHGSGELDDIELLQAISVDLLGEHDRTSLYGKIVDAAIAIARSQFGTMQLRRRSADGVSLGLHLLISRGLSAEDRAVWQWVVDPSRSFATSRSQNQSPRDAATQRNRTCPSIRCQPGSSQRLPSSNQSRPAGQTGPSR